MRTPEERFLAKVEKTDTCWLWTASENGRGYGQFWSGIRIMLAHRFAYEHFVGPIPDGLYIDHLCRTPLCVNPDHLEVVTCRENTMRGENQTVAQAAQTHCKRGHPLSGDNLYVAPGATKRACQKCRRMHERNRRARQKARRAKSESNASVAAA